MFQLVRKVVCARVFPCTDFVASGNSKKANVLRSMYKASMLLARLEHPCVRLGGAERRDGTRGPRSYWQQSERNDSDDGERECEQLR